MFYLWKSNWGEINAGFKLILIGNPSHLHMFLYFKAANFPYETCPNLETVFFAVIHNSFSLWLCTFLRAI